MYFCRAFRWAISNSIIFVELKKKDVWLVNGGGGRGTPGLPTVHVRLQPRLLPKIRTADTMVLSQVQNLVDFVEVLLVGEDGRDCEGC